jgi:peptide/nickel transport system substrate-binding protein
MLAPTVWPSLPANAPRYNTNISKAKALLKKAGYPHGLTLTLDTSNQSPFKELALVTQSSLQKAGIKVNIDLFTTGVLFQRIFEPAGKKPFSLAIFIIGPAMPDPDDIVKWYQTKFVTVINPGFGNRTTNSWISAAERTSSHAKRVALYQRLLRRMNQDAMGVWIAAPKYVQVMQKNVLGLRYVPYYTSFVNPYLTHKG